ncbi:hypothetical protein OZ410_13175 [Robiginitalea sp. M366]|uniref:hypothetical protein n=1 Tax=Robiginitalea aestuariiviva TaxID=3036903 RepID=UPI00240E89F4|nr:hypothetical protein [Robiginitalea aestuariiviva]MDG1573275.1 hypothetical protein [Robiginitalea aestuariiviva]
MTKAEKGEQSDPKVTRAYSRIVHELEQGRNVLQLYRQLSGALPIKHFGDLEKAFAKTGRVAFRDVKVPIAFFKDYIPEFLFPVTDEDALIAALAQLVQAMPSDIGYDLSKPETQELLSKRKFAKSLLPLSNDYSSNSLAAGHSILGASQMREAYETSNTNE